MAMVYGRTAKVSDAAKKVIGPDDPKARAEVEAERDQEFDIWDQIGLASDMIPPAAIAAGGAKAAAAGGRNVYKMISDSISGFKTGGSAAAKDAVLKWVSATDLNIMGEALDYIESLSGKALAEMQPVKTAIDKVYNQFSGRLQGHISLKPEGLPKPAGSSDPNSALAYVQDLQAKAKIPKATEEIMATKDLPASTRMSRDMPSPSANDRLAPNATRDIKEQTSIIAEKSDEQLDVMLKDVINNPESYGSSRSQEWFLNLIKDEIKRRKL